MNQDRDGTGVDKLLAIIIYCLELASYSLRGLLASQDIWYVPEWVMLSNAPVALRCTRISFDLARRIRGPSAPDRAILALFSSWVARLVIQPTALHCTWTLGDIIWRIRGASPPRATIKTLFSAKIGCQQSKKKR